jgi:pyruvate-formate lyase
VAPSNNKQRLFQVGFYISLLGFILTVVWQFAADAVISPEYMQLMYFVWFCLVVFFYVKSRSGAAQNNQASHRVIKILFITLLGIIGLVLGLISILLLGYALSG